MNKAVRDYKEDKGVARDYLQEVKRRLNGCNCVEEKEGRFDKLESNLETLLAEVDRVRKEMKLGNLVRKERSLGSDGGGYKKARKEGRLEITIGDREKKSNLLIHDSCEFRDGKLVREYGKFHYKKSFTKEELKKFKEAKKKNYHNRLIVQVEVPPK
ncbi:20128_t:CDS:2, partial [Funneliformis geosporum]